MIHVNIKCMLIGTTFIDFWIIRVIITKLALFFLATSGPCRQLGICLKQNYKTLTRHKVQLSGLMTDTGNTNLWQKISCHSQHLVCPSSSHEKLICVELWRETEGMQGSGSCWEGARGSTQCSSHLNLLPFCSTSTAVIESPLFAPLPPPQARKDSGPIAKSSSSGG